MRNKFSQRGRIKSRKSLNHRMGTSIWFDLHYIAGKADFWLSRLALGVREERWHFRSHACSHFMQPRLSWSLFGCRLAALIGGFMHSFGKMEGCMYRTLAAQYANRSRAQATIEFGCDRDISRLILMGLVGVRDPRVTSRWLARLTSPMSNS